MGGSRLEVTVCRLVGSIGHRAPAKIPVRDKYHIALELSLAASSP